VQAQLFMRRGIKTKTFVVDPKGRRVAYGNERITTPYALTRGLRGAGFEIRNVRPFRMLPNLNVSARWIRMEEVLLSFVPWMSTHFNVVAMKPGG